MSLHQNSILSKKHIIIVGDFGAGKSSILHRLIKKEFSKGFTNLSLDFCSYEMKHNNDTMHVFIWDSLGHDRLKSMTTNFYKKADGAIIVFDSTEEAYRDTVAKWMQTLSDHCSTDIPILIVGNKSDISLSHEKKVTEISTAFQASSNVVDVMSASAKNGDNVEEVFHKIIISTFDLSNESSQRLRKELSAKNSRGSVFCCFIV